MSKKKREVILIQGSYRLHTTGNTMPRVMPRVKNDKNRFI